MRNELSSGSPSSEFYLQVKQESAVFSNIMFILEKIESEHHLAALTATFKNIIDFEVTFAQAELRKIRGSFPNFDLNAQLLQNTLIFKENLKLISGSLIDSIWSQILKRATAGDEPLRTQEPFRSLWKPFDAIKELSEEEFSRSQSFNNIDGTCIETSPVNKIQRSCDKFSFELNIHGSARNSREVCLKELLKDPTLDNPNDPLIECPTTLAPGQSPTSNAREPTKLDRIIGEVMKLPPMPKASASILSQPERTSETERKKSGLDTDKSNDTISDKGFRVNTDVHKRNLAHDVTRTLHRGLSHTYSGTKTSSRSFEFDTRATHKERVAFDGGEYHDISERDSLTKAPTPEEEKTSCHLSASPKLDFPEYYRTSDNKRMSVCETISARVDHSTHWYKRSGTTSIKQSYQVSRDFFSKKKSLVFSNSTSKKRQEGISSEVADSKIVFRKKLPAEPRDRLSPEKGEFRNNTGKIKFLKV
jgi:hypothetical protein